MSQDDIIAALRGGPRSMPSLFKEFGFLAYKGVWRLEKWEAVVYDRQSRLVKLKGRLP